MASSSTPTASEESSSLRAASHFATSPSPATGSPRLGPSLGFNSLGTHRKWKVQPEMKLRAASSRHVALSAGEDPRPFDTASTRAKLSLRNTRCRPRLSRDLKACRTDITRALPSRRMMSSRPDHLPKKAVTHPSLSQEAGTSSRRTWPSGVCKQDWSGNLWKELGSRRSTSGRKACALASIVSSARNLQRSAVRPTFFTSSRGKVFEQTPKPEPEASDT